jgi:hypothetical protein
MTGLAARIEAKTGRPVAARMTRDGRWWGLHAPRSFAYAQKLGPSYRWCSATGEAWSSDTTARWETRLDTPGRLETVVSILARACRIRNP